MIRMKKEKLLGAVLAGSLLIGILAFALLFRGVEEETMDHMKTLEDHYNEIGLPQETKEDLLEHTQRVIELCRIFESQMDEELDWELLYPAAALHDIAKYDENGEKAKKHQKAAGDVIRRKLPQMKRQREVLDIIRVHRKDFDPQQDQALEAAVLRICDKLDRFAKGKEDAQDKCVDSMKDIEKYYEERGMELPEAFCRLYEQMLEKGLTGIPLLSGTQ